MRNIVGAVPVLLVVNKVDLLPRAGTRGVEYWRRRARDRGVKLR
jgi:ribosome biogenesis GTPase A